MQYTGMECQHAIGLPRSRAQDPFNLIEHSGVSLASHRTLSSVILLFSPFIHEHGCTHYCDSSENIIHCLSPGVNAYLFGSDGERYSESGHFRRPS